jgi:hypothetical protein
MGLEGNLKEFSLAEVLKLIEVSKKTGALYLQRDNVDGAIFFRDGQAYFARSDWNRTSLGTRLLKARKVTKEQLEEALAIQKKEEGKRRIGQILIERKYIDQEDLEKFVKRQILDSVFDIFRWPEGEFSFTAGEVAEEEDIGISISTDNLIMEASRRLKEWDRIKQKIPSLNVVLQMSEAPGEGERDILLKPKEWKFLRLIDGHRSIEAVVRMTGESDFEVCKVLYGLLSVGLLEVVE